MNLATKDIVLRPATEGDLSIMHEWRNSDSYRSLFANRRNLVSFDEFRVEYKKEKDGQRHVQFIVVLKRIGRPIGLTYSYGASMNDGFVFFGTYIDDQFQSKGYGAKASILMIGHLFDTYPIQKVCVDVFSYNLPSISGCENLGFTKEGEFVRQRFYYGKYWNVVRMALFRDNLDRLLTLQKRITNQ